MLTCSTLCLCKTTLTADPWTEYPNQTLIYRSIAVDKSSDIWQRSMEQIFPDTLEKYDINVISGPSFGVLRCNWSVKSLFLLVVGRF